MEIVVHVENKILGNGVFWKGDSKDIDQISNIVARGVAKRVAMDGKTKAMECGTLA